MPVYQLRDEMPYDELLGWNDFYARYPIGWREDQRIMMLLQAQGVKAKPEDLFNSLAIIKKSKDKQKDNNIIQAESFKRSGMFHFLANSANLPAVLK